MSSCIFFRDSSLSPYVDEKIAEIPVPDMTGYATENYVDIKIAEIHIPELDNYATKDYVDTKLLESANKVAPSPASVTLYADRWKQNENEQRWHQEVEVANATVTEYSKIDLQLSAEQIMIFYEKDLAFVAENDDGKVTVYCIGRVPENDYVVQATVSEVVING